MKMTYTATFTVKPATGSNRNSRRLEVMDETGIRLAYVNSEDEAAEEIRDALDPHSIWEGEVKREALLDRHFKT